MPTQSSTLPDRTHKMCPDPRGFCGFYPLCLSAGDLGYHDLSIYHADLERRAPELFVADEALCNTEIREYVKPASNCPHNHPGKCQGQDTVCEGHHSWSVAPSRPHTISTIESLRMALEKGLSPGSTRFITIYRANSWSRMKITFNMFRHLYTFSQMPVRFLDLIKGMEYKSSPRDEHFMTCYYYLRPGSEGSNTTEEQTQSTESRFDICYNLRFFERHERELQDPWSCRQSIIYQKYEFGTGTSLWIIVQPLKTWKAVMDNSGIDFDKITHPLTLHLRYICLVVSATWEYLEYLSSELLSLDQRSSFPKPVKDFDFDFTLRQQAKVLRKKLYHVKTILHGTTRTVEAVSSYAAAMSTSEHVPVLSHQVFKEELDNIAHDLLAHESTTNELLNLSGDIKSTIESILTFQNQDLFNNNESHLRLVAEANSKETHLMSQVARWTYKDSRTMRIATLIALIYLPVNLVFTFFSTVFVVVDPQANSLGVPSIENAGSRGIVVHEQVWIAVVSTIVLLLGTGGGFWLMEHRKESSVRVS